MTIKSDTRSITTARVQKCLLEGWEFIKFSSGEVLGTKGDFANYRLPGKGRPGFYTGVRSKGNFLLLRQHLREACSFVGEARRLAVGDELLVLRELARCFATFLCGEQNFDVEWPKP